MFKTFLKNLTSINPKTNKSEITKAYETYLLNKKCKKLTENEIKREREFDLVRDQMIDAFTEILSFNKNNEKKVDLDSLLKTMLNLGICMSLVQFSKKMLKVVYSSVHSCLSPYKLIEFLENNFKMTKEETQALQETSYKDMMHNINQNIDDFIPQTLLFLLKMIPKDLFKTEIIVEYIKKRFKK